ASAFPALGRFPRGRRERRVLPRGSLPGLRPRALGPAPPRGFVAIVRPPRADESGSLDKPAYPRDSRNRPLYRAASGMALILGPAIRRGAFFVGRRIAIHFCSQSGAPKPVGPCLAFLLRIG